METIEKHKTTKMPQEEGIKHATIQSQEIKGEEKEAAQTSFADYSYYASGTKEKEEIDFSVCKTPVIHGKGLLLYYDKVKNYKKRECYHDLYDYIVNDYTGRVCILYGLRRTGKTTMLYQLLHDIDISKTVYIKVDESNTMGDLIKDINYLTKQGIQYFLIDEVTLLSDFINSAASLSDIYCSMGYKIVLSGTDSLGFDFARRDELYDRTVTIHTSYIPYKEFANLLYKSDIDDYIEYGGTLQKENMKIGELRYKESEFTFLDDNGTRKYIDTAISQNIQRSLRNERFGSKFYFLKELYDNNELTNAINRIVESMNHDFVLSVIQDLFVSHDLGSARQMLLHERDEEVQFALSNINEKAVLDTLKEIIKVREASEAKVQVTQEAVDQIKSYLYALDLIKDVEIRYANGKIKKEPVFTQPGMRYSIAKALCHSLMQDEAFGSINEKSKEIILNKILSDVKGRMLEEIVLLESTFAKKSTEIVFKYIDNITWAECDMVKYNKRKDSFVAYEIKHAKKANVATQAKHLNNKNFMLELSKKYGTLEKKVVLYRGHAQEIDGIKYLPVDYYLKNL